MITAALVAALLRLPTDLAPEPEPADLSSGDWVLPMIIGAAVLVVLAVVATVVLKRRRAR